ncbi:MAG: hypothetical protein WD248_02055 [Actinomycetota bacterium]
MPETRMPEDTLAVALRDAGRDLAYPPTPPISQGVVARLEAERERRTRPRFPTVALWSRRRVLVLVAVGVIGLLALAFAARLVIGAAEIRVQPGVTPSGPPLGPGALGDPVPVERVERAVGFAPRVPAGPPPDEAYVFVSTGGNGALLAWEASDRYPSLPGTPWGLILVELRTDEGSLVKDVGGFDDIQEVRVDGRSAFWIEAPHELHVITDGGSETFRVDGNVLIWTAGAVTYRLETSFELPEAVALAESLH